MIQVNWKPLITKNINVHQGKCEEDSLQVIEWQKLQNVVYAYTNPAAKEQKQRTTIVWNIKNQKVCPPLKGCWQNESVETVFSQNVASNIQIISSILSIGVKLGKDTSGLHFSDENCEALNNQRSPRISDPF